MMILPIRIKALPMAYSEATQYQSLLNHHRLTGAKASQRSRYPVQCLTDDPVPWPICNLSAQRRRFQSHTLLMRIRIKDP